MWLSGAIAGVLMNYGARVGWYHEVFLPLILLEMEQGSLSLVGTLDWLTLCIVGAGACAAQLAFPLHFGGSSQTRSDGPLARRGLAFNLLYGDYIEACYPFLERDPYLNAAAYAASACSGALVACAGARSTAYLPAPLAVWLSDTPAKLAVAAGIAFGIPFAAGSLSNVLRRRRD